MPELQARFTERLREVLGERTSMAIEVAPDWLRRPGQSELGPLWPFAQRVYTQLTGMQLPQTMPPREHRRVDVVVTYSNGGKQIVEFDETQHFTSARRVTLGHYAAVKVGFDVSAWVRRCEQLEGRAPAGGFARPKPPLFPEAGGRHLQRAFRDFLADVMPQSRGWLPTVRFSDEEYLAIERSPDPLDALTLAWHAKTADRAN